MGVPDNTSSTAKFSLSIPKLKKLSLEQVKQIDEALASIGEYGEIHLILQRGELRYINKVESLKAWKNYDHPDQ
jgi:hypothetical protein